MRVERELMRGAGPIAVLKLLEDGEKYGYELVEALSQRTDGVLGMGQSTLYPLLYNLEAQKLIKPRWAEADNGRKRKYYSLTAKGKKRLAHDTAQWQAVATAMQSLEILPKSGPKLEGGVA
ncbi:MAG: helix-turn-helix transcriptional regulator [Planctomycetaceae bacterium]|nr:helix-turn-helix transcriptional regulator [Planctomycetaceae bacterium]